MIFTEQDIASSQVLRLITTPSDKPVFFMPNLGEFGGAVHKLTRMVHWKQAPYKVVCCKKGEEALYPTANEFYYDWLDFVDDANKAAFFTKRRYAGGRRREYKRIYHQEKARIEKAWGPKFEYIELWPYSYDRNFYKYMNFFKVPLKPLTLYNLDPDIVISSRNRALQPERNFQQWPQVVECFHKEGFTIGCLGRADTAKEIPGVNMYSWYYEDNTSAAIEMLQNCRLYIGSNTGPSHLAAFLSRPMVFFGSSYEKYYGSWLIKLTLEESTFFQDLGQMIGDHQVVVDAALAYLHHQ